MNIPKLIRQKRLELGENQEQFGKRLGLSHAAVSDLERGVTTSLSFELAEMLFNLEDDGPTASDYINYGYNKALNDVVSATTSLTHQRKKNELY